MIRCGGCLRVCGFGVKSKYEGEPVYAFVSHVVCAQCGYSESQERIEAKRGYTRILETTTHGD